jgi:hypothetical protein
MIETQKKGLQSKLLAMEHFVSSGFFIYNEMNNTGPIDFVAVNPILSETYLIEVKTLSRRSDNSRINRPLTSTQKNLGVKMVYVDLKNLNINFRK